MSHPHFIGRDTELDKLNNLLHKKASSLVIIRGRRRIGKSRLAGEFAKNMTCYQFSGLAPDKGVKAQHQRDEFAFQLSQQTNLPTINTHDWSQLFLLLAEKTAKGRVIILLDEITWIANGDPTFLSKLKNAWDLHFSKNNKLTLILCGSISTWIEKNIINSTGFLRRISLDLVLHELSVMDANDLLYALNFKRSAKEKALFLSLTDCIPWYIEQINPTLSAEDNIKQLCFEPNALMTQEFKRVFHDLFGKRGDIYQKIVNALASRSLDYTQLSEKLGYAKSSQLSHYLSELEYSAYITKSNTWSIKTGKPSKLAKYRLSDNYLRFYFKYILPKIDAINKGQYATISINQLPDWQTTLGLQFENLVLGNRSLTIDLLNIKPEDIIMDNPYFQRQTLQQKSCQIDYLIQTKLNTLFACEIKFSNKIKMSEIIKTMKEKLKRVSLPKGFSILPVLIHFGEIDDDIDARDYFHEIIDFSMLFQNDLY